MEDFGPVLFVALIAVVIQLSRSTGRIKKLEQEFETQQARVLDLNKRLILLSREVELLRSPVAGEPPLPGPPLPVEVREEPPLVVSAPVEVTAPEPVAVQLPPLPAPEPEPEPEIPVAVPPPPAPEPVAWPAIPIPIPISKPPKPPRPPFDWESLVGVRLFSWMAGIMLVIAAILFLRYSIQHGWLGAPVRMAIGVLTGAGLLAVCEWKAARRYTVTANALDAAGIAILFATFFASHVLWGLLNATTAFLLMALVAGVAVALALRRNAPFIAVLGLLGGFATPALLSSGQDRPITLFGYLLLLNGGLAWVAVRRRWTLLVPLSLVFTFLYQWGWVLRRLDPERLPLAIGIFLVFPALHMLVLALSRQPADEEKPFWDLSGWSLGLPLLLAVYLAASPGFGAHYGLLFGFLLLLGVALAVYGVARGPALFHNLAAGATVIVYGLWLVLSYRSEAWPGILGFLSLEVLLYLGAPWLARLWKKDLPVLPGSLAVPLLLGAFPLLLLREPAAASPGLTFGVLFLLLLASAAAALVYRSGWLHFGAAFFAVAAEAVWSSRYLTPGRLLPGLALYAVFGLFYLGVPLAARRLGRRLEPEGAGSVVLLLGLALLGFLSLGTVAASAVWGLALLLALLNAGLFVEAREARRPILATVGVMLSWILIALWWATVPLGDRLGPALMLVALFSLLSLAGSIWSGRATTEGAEGGEQPDQGVYLALIGHLFLVFVATRPDLAIPPWPLLGILAVLVLAAGVAALALRRGALQVASLVMAQLVLLVLLHTATNHPWPSVALVSAALFAGFGLAWIPVARRRDTKGGEDLALTCSRGAVAALFSAQIVAAVACELSGSPSSLLSLLVQVALASALLWLSSRGFWPWVAPVSVLTTFLAAWAFHHGSGWERLTLAAALWLVYLAYPVVLGKRARQLREPWLAAVLASVAFFLVARPIVESLGFESVIGLLPVVQAAALAFLLWRLISLERGESAERSEPTEERDRGRLALMAGAVLAFVTVAIPLQLEKQWITIGWALLAAALAWLYGRIPHRGLLFWTAGLTAAVFTRLSLNPDVLAYHPRAEVPVLNWYLYTYLVSAVALLAAARLLRRTDDNIAASAASAASLPRMSTLASAAAGVLLFLLLNIEIADFFSTGETLTFAFLSGRGTLAEGLTYTLGWAIFALALLVTGIALRSRGARVTAIGLLVVTVIKGFLFDLSSLGGLYRVASFVGMAVCLAAVAVLIQKFVLARPEEERG